MARIKICKESDCHNAATTAGYCRLHYLKNWKNIKSTEKRRAAKNLNAYIQSVCRKYPDRYMEVIKKDLRSPHFDKYIEENFGYDDEAEDIFNEPTYEEEVERLIKELKIEKDF